MLTVIFVSQASAAERTSKRLLLLLLPRASLKNGVLCRQCCQLNFDQPNQAQKGVGKLEDYN